MRKNLYEIISGAGMDLAREYSRLYNLFYSEAFTFSVGQGSIANYAAYRFRGFDRQLIGRCLSLEDFNETHNFVFEFCPRNLSVDYFLRFVEYIYNITKQVHRCEYPRNIDGVQLLLNNAKECMADIGYTDKDYNGITIFVEENASAEAVAEITEGALSYKVIEYNHFRMKGDLTRKLQTLKMMADDIELQRKMLNSINKSFTEDLFQMFNKFVRHDCSDNPYIADMTSDEVEVCYDDIYQMWLLAKLEIDHLDRKKRVKTVLDAVNGNVSN